MNIELHSFLPSAPCRMVLLLAKHLDIPLKVTNVDLFKKEQLKEEYLQLNPLHTVPTMVDNGFILTESRAMLMYLANKYGKDQSLYPKVPQERAIVDTRLFFDISTLFPRWHDAFAPVMAQRIKPDPEKLAKLDEALALVEGFLTEGYVAGGTLTIADFSIAVLLSTFEACQVDMAKFPRITAYLIKCKTTMKGWDELNRPGNDMIGQFCQAALAAAQS